MILVTGGTGFVGRHLVPKLVKEGEKVRCLVRSRAKAEALQQHGVEVALGDVTEPSSLKEAMRDIDTIIHLVAIIREGKGVTFDGVNVQGTRNAVRVAQESGVSRFMHMSALGAGPNPSYRYTYSKWQGEEAVRGSKLDFTIFRPSVIFGQSFGYSFIDRMVQPLTMFPFIAPVPGSGKARFQPIWVEDTVSCILQALMSAKASQTYELGGPEHLTYEEMLDAVMHALGIRQAKAHIPMLLMRPAVAIMEKVMRDPLVTSVELAQLKIDNITDLDTVEHCFGFRPLSLGEWLAKGEWHIQAGEAKIRAKYEAGMS